MTEYRKLDRQRSEWLVANHADSLANELASSPSVTTQNLPPDPTSFGFEHWTSTLRLGRRQFEAKFRILVQEALFDQPVN
jgi:hypothetical protein